MKDVLIIGAGLSGLTAACKLAGKGMDVAVLDDKSLPRHKVCGEYLSREVVPYLIQKLGIIELDARPIVNKLVLSTASGNSIKSELDLGGVGVSRYFLDHALKERAEHLGASIQFRTKVKRWKYSGKHYEVESSKGDVITARALIIAAGKSKLSNSSKPDKYAMRYVGIKRYLKVPFDDSLVVLHNFKGGYCGAVKVETGMVDVAYMVEQKIFERYKDITKLEQNLLFKNHNIKHLYALSESDIGRPYAISNFTLGVRKLVEDHAIRTGDSAGMIPPFSGNGMAMAIRGGAIAADSVYQFLKGEVDLNGAQTRYVEEWKKTFRNRLFWGLQIQRLMGTRTLGEVSMLTLKAMPFLLPVMIRKTHGEIWDGEAAMSDGI